jgi:hypothetical protein
MEYTLDICGEKQIQNPTEADIRQAVLSLDTDKNSAFVILATSDMTYLQAIGDNNVGFDLEYQDGDTEHHYQAKRNNITGEEIIRKLVLYCAGTDDWKKAEEWGAIKV